MVERIFKILYKEFSGLHQAAFLLGIFAIASQTLALVRDRLFAHFLGAGTTLDLYYAAFRIPDFIFVSVASLVSITVLIPLIIERMNDNEEKVKVLINNVFTAFLIGIILISAVIFFLVPSLNAIIFSGFSNAEQDTLVVLTRILLLSPILLGISNLFGSVTQTFRRFFVYALSPVFYNIGIIAGMLFLYPLWGVTGLVWGVVFGALLHLAIQIPVIVKQGFLPKIIFSLNKQLLQRVILLSLPRTLGLSAHQIAFFVLIGLASLMVEGSISIFSFSWNLQSVPLAIIGVSYSVAAFPTLARLFSNNEVDKFVKNILVATRHIFFWSLPVVVLFIVLRAQIVRTILGTGEFGWTETRLTAAALALFVVSLVAQSLVLLFVRGYYAAGKTMKPLLVNILSAGGIIVSAYFLINLFESSQFFKDFIEVLFRVEDIPGTSVLMLPLAYSIGMLINAIVLFFMFDRDFHTNAKTLYRTFWHSFSGAIVMGFVAYQALQYFDDIFDLETFMGIFLQGFISGVIGIIAGIILLRLMGSEELYEVGRSLHSKFWKARPVAPEQDEL